MVTNSSRSWLVVGIVALFILAVAGLSWWVSSRRSTPTPVATTATPAATNTTHMSATSASIDSALSDVDKQITNIQSDMSSTNDNAPAL